MITKRNFLSMPAMLLVLSIAACGGSDSDNNQASNNPGASAGESDAFFAQVKVLIATTPETSEPIPIDSIAVTTPESIEPATSL